jgi:signal transduction histidine kinase
MADENILRGMSPAKPGPFFRARVKVAAFAGAFAFFLAVQAVAVWGVYASARAAVREVLGRELSGAAASGAWAMGIGLTRGTTDREFAEMAWRIRELNRLDACFLVDEGMGTPSRGGDGARVAASVFAATPSRVAEALRARAPVGERYTLFGETYRRVYQPVMGDGGAGQVLVLDAHDRSAGALEALRTPLAVGMAVAASSALALAVVVVLLMHFFDRSKQELIRVERLATAGALASSIAHEVKNPMGIILSSAQLLRDDARLGEDQRVMLDGIVEEVKRAELQLDSFLDLVRDIPLKLASEDLRELLEGIVRLLQPALARSNAHVARAFPGAPVRARVDRRKIRQAVINLMLNAKEALAPRGGTITLTLRSTDDGIVVEVADDGPGMDAHVRRHAAEPFFSTKSAGTGLGLAQSRMVVERHGGTFHIDSAPGLGTRVKIVLPHDRDPHEDVDRR